MFEVSRRELIAAASAAAAAASVSAGVPAFAQAGTLPWSVLRLFEDDAALAMLSATALPTSSPAIHLPYG